MGASTPEQDGRLTYQQIFAATAPTLRALNDIADQIPLRYDEVVDCILEGRKGRALELLGKLESGLLILIEMNPVLKESRSIRDNVKFAFECIRAKMNGDKKNESDEEVAELLSRLRRISIAAGKQAILAVNGQRDLYVMAAADERKAC